MLHLYAVCLNTSDPEKLDDWWIELFWAENQEHAEEQAEDSNPHCAIVCVAQIPYDYTRKPSNVN
jgi:hypothetical protein